MWLAVAQALSHVDGRLRAGGVEAAAERLAVDGHDLAVADFMQRGDPTQQTLLELGRLDRPQNGVEAIVRGNAGRKIEKLGQPVALRLTPAGDGHEIIGPANHGAQGDHDDVDQRMSNLAATRIGQLGEVLLQTRGGHDSIPWASRPAATESTTANPTRIDLPSSTSLPSMAQSP